MKVTISGPRRTYTEPWGWMHIELELEELPKIGEVIILNDGSSYYVTNIMWWIQGPRNEAYWSMGEDDYRVEGSYEAAGITVEPDNRRECYGYPAGLEDGRVQGADEFLAELRGLVDLTKRAIVNGGTYDGLGMIDVWLGDHEEAMHVRLEEKARQVQLATELFARMEAAAKERSDGQAQAPGDGQQA